MEKPNGSGLTNHDKALIRRIDELYAIGSQMLGNEILMYYEFGITPDKESAPEAGLIQSRQQVFHERTRSDKPQGDSRKWHLHQTAGSAGSFFWLSEQIEG